MPPSTAEREKLISGTSLLLIAGLFLAAFVLLRPSASDFQLTADDNPLQESQPLGELELAYLRARVAKGEQSPDEVSLALQKLIDAQQFSDAKAMLADHPDVLINDADRFRLELEMTANGYGRDKAGSPVNAELSSLLHSLVKKPSLHSAEILLRASRLSHKLVEPGLSAQLYLALAENDQSNAVYWYEECVNYASSASDNELAQSCLRSAMLKTEDPEKEFSLKLRMLALLAETNAGDDARPGYTPAQDVLAGELLAMTSHSVPQLEALATALLAVERPEHAIGVYEKLATNDPLRRVHWLNQAARWSEATSQHVRAVSLLDQTRSELDEDALVVNDQRVEALLIAAGEQSTALERVALRLESEPDNVEVLESGTVLAQQSGDLSQAMLWNTRLLALQPRNADAVNRQVTLSLAEGELQSAYEWSRKSVELQPENLQSREQLAKLSEWTARPNEAVEHWQFIDAATRLRDDATVTSTRQSTQEVVRLAEMTLQPAIAANALQRSVAFNEPSDADIARLIKFHELDGKPHLAAEALDKTMQRWGDSTFRLEQLAALHWRHINYAGCLAAWQRYEALVGATPRALLNQIEMHWRLGQSASAVELGSTLASLPDMGMLPSDASAYQVMVLSEIGWRYQQDRLTLLTRSRIHQLEQLNQRTVIGHRLVDVLIDLGQKDEAIVEATRLWQDTRGTDFALKAMELTFTRGDNSYPDHFLDEGVLTRDLHQQSRYWSQLAAMQLRNGDHLSAQASYRRALTLAPNGGESLSGLLWLHIGRGEQAKIAQILNNHNEFAQSESQLWAAFAIGHLQLGNAQASLLWFAKLGDSIDADYNMLLLYADALALADKADQAHNMRRYALKKLRPQLAQETLSDHQILLRQYAQLLGHYGSAEEQEQLTEYLLNHRSDSPDQQTSDNTFWREDMAIGWLMSTQRHEQARVIMARIQQQRLATPEWQLLAMAIRDQDRDAIESVLSLGGALSAGDRVLALRTLGSESMAQALVVNSRQRARTVAERKALTDQYASIRRVRPDYAGSLIRSSEIRGLSISEVGVAARHTFELSELGISFEYVQRYLKSRRFLPASEEEESDLAVALHFGGQQAGGHVGTGFISSELDERVYVNGLYFRTTSDQRRTYSLDLAYNENIVDSAQLRLGAVRHRAGVALDNSMRNNQFFNFQVSASEIQTRVSDKRFARGLQTRLEYGFRGARGANNWSTSVVADNSQYDRVDELPDELQLSPGTSLDQVLAEESTSLSIGASLNRGSVNSDFPQVSSPRYHLATRLGRTWPDDSYGLQLAAGAGVRLLGGDELSFGLSWEWLTEGSRLPEASSTSFGLNYKYHF